MLQGNDINLGAGRTQRRDWNCEFNLLESVGSKDRDAAPF
jgi:hypothetical protein